MKKFLLSFVVLLSFVIYARVLRQNTNAIGLLPQPSFAPLTPTSPTPLASPIPSGQYKDGSYTGPSTDAFYGNVQVRAIIQNGRLTDVQFLDYPHDRSTSLEINGQATPMLRTEAIQAQSAQVDIVSGATDTSMAFQQSLSAALTQAQ